MTKFRKFQRPVDFEPKLSHVKRMLDEIEERIHLIEIRSEDPDVMQAQLEHCMVSAIDLLKIWMDEAEFGIELIEKRWKNLEGFAISTRMLY